MGIKSSNSIQHFHDVLTQIQTLCAKASQEGNSDKHQQIRVTHWVRKLRSQPISNPTWLKSVLEYANMLLQMLLEGVIEEPFTKMPPQGPLAALPRYQVVRLTKAAKQIARVAAVETRVRQQETQCNNLENAVQYVAAVQKVDRQIQTQEQDDQWEWQRVWKGAFDKLRQQLQSKMEEMETLVIENKELRVLVASYKKAEEEAERKERDKETKHLAEIENLRAVHALELSKVQARHRQKLQEVVLQNDEKLFIRRREKHFIRSVSTTGQSQDENIDTHSDFLQYIDAFYSSTLDLTAQNKL